MEQTKLTQDYRCFTICGAAAPVHNDSGLFFAEGSVLLLLPDNCVLLVLQYYDPFITCDDEDLAK